jgi:hypothetical protein
MWYLSQNSRNFLSVNWDLLSVIMEFDTPNRWMMSVKNDTACSALRFVIGHLDPLGEFIHGDQQVSVAPGRLSQGPDDVQSPHSERPCDENRLQGVSREITLAGVELASLAGSYDLVGVSDRGGPVKALAEHIADEGTRCHVVATHARVDVSNGLATLGDGDALAQDAGSGALVQLVVDYGE